MEIHLAFGDIIALIGVVGLGIGLAFTWRRNGLSQARRDGELQAAVNDTNQKVDATKQKVEDLQQTVAAHQQHCSGCVATFTQQITTLFKNDDDQKHRLDQLDRRQS